MVIEEPNPQSHAREIELELIRVRASAEAARLEARAAELELMLRRMARGEVPHASLTPTHFDAMASAETYSPSPLDTSSRSATHTISPSQQGPTPRLEEASSLQNGREPDTQDSWTHRLNRLHTRDHLPSTSIEGNRPFLSDAATAPYHSTKPNHSTTPYPSPTSPTPSFWTPSLSTQSLSPPGLSTTPLPGSTASQPAHEDHAWNRVDPPQVSKPATDVSAFGSATASAISSEPVNANVEPTSELNITVYERDVEPTASEQSPFEASMYDTIVTHVSEQESLSPTTPPPAIEITPQDVSPKSKAKADQNHKSDLLPIPSTLPYVVKKVPALPGAEVKLSTEEEVDEKSSRKLRPASWFVSTLAHCGVLVLLGFMTLSNPKPKDQLAFTASAPESSEQTMETFEIESSEPVEPTEPVAAETAYEISDMGTLAVTEVSMDIPAAPAPPTTADLMTSSLASLSSSSMKALKGEAMPATQFCGVDGGGSHFVYLVDSSGSMGAGFQSARTELLNSIDQLKPDQRFYVVFFDEEPDYMRLSDPNVNEAASVMATADNKQRLQKWASTVEMNKGKAPYEVLPFALSLRPDVIFLLSDGEFPTAIEEILREQNRDENLFGESGPISIVHTIRYHGREGQEGRNAEATMIKIAKENGGQYRHVPKPSSKATK